MNAYRDTCLVSQDGVPFDVIAIRHLNSQNNDDKKKIYIMSWYNVCSSDELERCVECSSRYRCMVRVMFGRCQMRCASERTIGS